jgi:predicted O-linked N-acetylglucosamine transferase (SPINDLY family)
VDDALVAGLPVLGCLGKSFPARLTASRLHAAGLAEMVADDAGDFERRAVDLAGDPDRLARIRAKLAAAQSTSALFDLRPFVQNVEAAFETMHARHRAGMWPAPLVLPGG